MTHTEAMLWREIQLLKRRLSGFVEGSGGGTPDAHAASHQNGGTDEINVAGLSGLLADDQSPTAHATDHEDGGADPVDVTQLDGFPGGTATFLRADATFAAPAAGTDARLLVAVKTGDETVNNSDVLQNDDHLSFAVAASGIYLVDLYLLTSSVSATPDFKWDWTVPAGATYYWGNTADPSDSSDGTLGGWGQRNISSGSAAALSSGTLTHGSGSNVPKGVHLIAIVIVGGTAGTAQFRWSQNSATSEDTKLLIGSCIIAVKVN